MVQGCQELLTSMPTAFPNLIDGRTVDSADRVSDVNPSNVNDIVGEFARGTTTDVEAAIAAAKGAFAKWSQSTPQERFDVLDRAGTEILARKEELGRLLSREQGKPLADGIGEAGRAGAIFKFFAEQYGAAQRQNTYCYVGVLTPDVGEKLLAAEDAAGGPHEVFEKAELGRGQVHLPAGAADAASLRGQARGHRRGAPGRRCAGWPGAAPLSRGPSVRARRKA